MLTLGLCPTLSYRVHGMRGFTGVKVFSATLQQQRDALGARVTGWLAEHPGIVIVDKVITQSSDAAFHCMSIVLFYVDAASMPQAARTSLPPE